MSSLKDKKRNAKIKRWIKRKGYNEDFTFQDDCENALEDGDEKRVEKLMKRNPSELVNDDRTNALLFASRRGFDDAVRIILEENEEIIDDIGLNGYAAIHYAAKYGHEDILLMLILHGADLNIPDDGGAIALHYVASSEHLKILKVLIKNGADVNAKIIFKNLCYATLRWTRNCTPQKESLVFFDSRVVQGSIRRRLRTIRTRCETRTEQEIVCFSLVLINSSIFRVSFYVTEKRLKDTFLGWIKRLKTL